MPEEPKPEGRVRFSVSITLAQKAWIDKRAKEKQVSAATIHKWALTQYMERVDAGPP